MSIWETPPPALSATRSEVVDYIRDLARTLTEMARRHELGLVAHYLELAEDAAWEVDTQCLALRAAPGILAGEPILHCALGHETA